MPEHLTTAVDQFLTKYPEVKESGRKTTPKEVKDLDANLKSLIPQWYIELLKKYPLVDAEIGLPFDFGQPDLKGKPTEELPLLAVSINDLATLEEEALESFPGCELIENGFICIGKDQYSTGEGIYINAKDDNPALYLVFHDMGETPEELIDNAHKLTDSFIELFTVGKIE